MYVYVLRSTIRSDQIYVGLANDARRRLEDHNQGLSHHTSKFRPWVLEIAVWVSDPKKAYPFERWLKSGSGRAFRLRHF